MITGSMGMLPSASLTSKVLVCMNRQAAQHQISQAKHRQPDCANSVAGTAAALQLDADDAACAIERAINRALEEAFAPEI